MTAHEAVLIAKGDYFLGTKQAEQSVIAAILSDMDTEFTTLESHRDKAKQLKQDMMQKLLTRRIRLL